MGKRSTLFVTGLSVDTRAKDVALEFERYGPLIRCDIPTPNGRSRGYAFVEFEEENDAHTALEKMDKQRLDGREIIVQMAKRSPARSWRDNDRRRSPSPRRRDRRDYRDRRRDYRDRGRDRSRERDRSRDRDYEHRRRRDSRSPDRKRRRSASPVTVSSPKDTNEKKDISKSPEKGTVSPRKEMSPRKEEFPKRESPEPTSD